MNMVRITAFLNPWLVGLRVDAGAGHVAASALSDVSSIDNEIGQHEEKVL